METMSARFAGVESPESSGVRGRNISGFSYLAVKKFIEPVIAALMLIALCPLILMMLFLVRITSRGPVIYMQQRVGLDGRLFTIFKVRTMRLDSEPNGAVWCQPGDPRVTLIGRILRMTHLDELPQLVNVLRGEMSLIGPRPERPSIVAELEKALPDYQMRHQVLPGLTGLSQVLQAPDVDLGSVRRKLTYDLYYTRAQGLGLDLRIYLGTVLLFLGVSSRAIAAVLRFPYEPPTSTTPPAPALEHHLQAEGLS
jgi:lipopolysaccharide/colanic/teichoic acid biosynthesis glycosyltransferase